MGGKAKEAKKEKKQGEEGVVDADGLANMGAELEKLRGILSDEEIESMKAEFKKLEGDLKSLGMGKGSKGEDVNVDDIDWKHFEDKDHKGGDKDGSKGEDKDGSKGEGKDLDIDFDKLFEGFPDFGLGDQKEGGDQKEAKDSKPKPQDDGAAPKPEFLSNSTEKPEVPDEEFQRSFICL